MWLHASCLLEFNIAVATPRVAIAYGRDAADVAVYTQFGDPVELTHLNVNVERRIGPP